MKKIAISLLALAALSTAALAGRDHDLRDSDTYFGKYSNQLKNESTSDNALVIVKKRADTLTAFERMKQNAEENETSGR